MKKVILLFLVLFSFNLKAQKKYHFDTILEFEKTINSSEGKNDSTSIYFINSKNNSYVLSLIEKDSLNLSLNLKDHEGLLVTSLVNKKLLYEAETISNTCESVLRYSNTYKYQTKNYYFENLRDTVVKDVSYKHYVIRSNRSFNIQEKKQILKYHYIVKKEDSSHLPFLIHPTPYEEWKQEKNIPNGQLYMFYCENLKGEISNKLTLKNSRKTDKYFTIPEECDYTNPKI